MSVVRYGTNQVAKMLKVSQVHVIKQINSGRLRAEKVGNQYIIEASDLTEYVMNRRPVGRPKQSKDS